MEDSYVRDIRMVLASVSLPQSSCPPCFCLTWIDQQLHDLRLCMGKGVAAFSNFQLRL